MKESEVTPLARLAAAVKEQVDTSAAERAALLSCAEKLRAGVDALQSELQAVNSNGERRGQSMDAQLTHLRQAVAESEQTADEFRRKLRSTEDALAQQRRLADKAAERVAQLEKVLAENTDAAQVARNRIEDLTHLLDARDEALHELPALEQKLASLELELQKKSLEAAKAGKAEERLAQLEQQLREKTGLADAAEAARRRIAELERSIEAEAEQIAEWESKAAQLQSELDVARQDFAADQERLEVELAESQRALESERETRRKQESDLAREKQATAAAADRANDLDKTLREQRKSLEAMQSEIAGLRREDASGALEDARLQLATLEAELAATQQIVEQLQAQAANSSSTAAQDGVALSARIEVLENQLKQVQSEKRFLVDELKQALSQRDESRKELLGLRKKVNGNGSENEGEKLRRVTTNGKDDNRRQRVGDILVDAGVITAEELKIALEEQKKNQNTRLGSILVALNFASEDVIAQALGVQRNIEFARLTADAIDSRAVQSISGRLAEHHACIPIRITDEALTLAMVNPLDLIAIEDVERASGLRVEPVVATNTDIVTCIHQHYHNVSC